jgi:DNA-binding GntR family transcriptional regulator
MESNLIGYKSLKECVYDYMRNELENGGLKPGDTIDEKSLSEKLKVSRTPIREALIQLEVEGFVTIMPRRRIYVNELKEKDIENIYQIVGALEGKAAVRAIEKISDKEIEELELLFQKMKKALDKGDFSKYMHYNLASHEFFLKLNDNELLTRIVNLLKKRLYDFPETIKKIPEWEDHLMEHHRKMIELCKKKDKEGIQRLLSDVHWNFEWNRPYLLSYYSKDDLEKL